MSAEMGQQIVTAADVASWVQLVKAGKRATNAWKPKAGRKDRVTPRTSSP